MLEVLDPAVFSGLTLPATLREELAVDEATASDERLERVILSASARIARACNRRTFGRERLRQTENIRAHGTGFDALPLDNDLSPSIVSVSEGGAALAVGQWALDGSRLYRVAAGAKQAWATATVVVEYWGGFALVEDVPPDLQEACIALCRTVRSASTSTREADLKRIKIMDIIEKEWAVGSSATATTGLPPDVEEMVAPWRRVVLV
jgi:hypothetical protein